MTDRHVIRIAEPVVAGQTARFAWTVEPASDLYRRTTFELSFPDSVALGRVPRQMWWRVALVCLHSHWPLLRPCRVVLPVALGDGEREFWLRLCDAEIVTLEANAGHRDTARAIELVERGPALEPLEPVADAGVVVACFSGGRDSLTQAALLHELGERPVLVTTTSPREGSIEHETPRRRHVMSEVQRRRGLELVEVRSDFRGCWDNNFAAVRYGRSVNELTDTFLYFAAALVVAVGRGARSVYLASETEVQESSRRDGEIVQHEHCMYSAATQRALSALLAPAAISYGAISYPLQQFQVQRLLSSRYSDLRDLQYSCFDLAPEQSACSECDECRLIAFNLMAEGVAPREIGIDLAHMLVSGWLARRPDRDASLPDADRLIDAQLGRCVQQLTTERMAAFIEPEGPLSERGAAALRAYEQIRAAVLSGREPGSEPGYRAGFLELVAEPLRGRLAAILDEHFEREPLERHRELVDRSVTLSDWISAPLLRPQLDRRAGGRRLAPRLPRARPPEPVVPSESELAPIHELIPAPEPLLGERPSGRTIRVAETLLDGNELRYVSECVTTGWVSSAGAFVARFEEAFAKEAGCRYAVACSSGTTALQLALGAVGIGPGDEVIVPAFTMIAAANAVAHVGAAPVLVDSDSRSWNLDTARIADRIGPRTRAIMIMHTYGHPVDADAVAAVAAANDLVVIEDAAEAHGAEFRGRRAGSLGRVAAFSFYGNKIVTTGEGGMVTTDDERIAATARALRDHAFSPERHFWHRFRAFNFRMSNLQAALGLAQVERFDALLGARRATAARYREALNGLPGIELPPLQAGHLSADWMFGILVGASFGCSRDALREQLAAEGIETRTFFVPLHLQPAYLDLYSGQRYPVAERLGSTGLYLPSGPTLDERDVETVGAAIRRAAHDG